MPAIVSSRLTAGSSTTVLSDIAVERVEILAEPVQLAQVPLDRAPLVIGQDLLCKPSPPRSVEQLGMRARRDQMGGQDRMDLVLYISPKMPL